MIRKSVFAQSFDDLVNDAYEENDRRDQEANLRAKVEEVLKEYIDESIHEGEPMTASDFAIYLNEQFEQ